MNRAELKTFAARAREWLFSALLDESAAFDWFLRLTALRFLELRGFTDVFKTGPAPEKNRIRAACQQFRVLLPAVFDTPTEDDLPEALLQNHDFWEGLLSIPESFWQPELPGWLFQFYQRAEKDRAYAVMQKKQRCPERALAAATSLFTPRWLARYMTENTLVRAAGLTENTNAFPYFVPGTGEVPVPSIPPENLRFLDPCMGSGHLLLRAFDTFLALYRAEGISPREAVKTILSRNLYGLELDARGWQTACLSLMMKACDYEPALLSKGVPLSLFHFAHLPKAEDFSAGSPYQNAARALTGGELLGSLLSPESLSLPAPQTPHETRLFSLYNALTARYDAVATNPPYLGAARMPQALSDFVRAAYPAGRADLCACFLERCRDFTTPRGYFSLLTQHSWLFLHRFSALRDRMLGEKLLSLLHLGANAFASGDTGTIVQTACFTFQHEPAALGGETRFYRLTGESSTTAKRDAFLAGEHLFLRRQEDFRRIPGAPFVYWAPSGAAALFGGRTVADIAEVRQGMTTSDNDRFVRFWWEVRGEDIEDGARSLEDARLSPKKWFPYNKGGGFRKWYGNALYVVNFQSGGEEMRAFHVELQAKAPGGRIKNEAFYFRPAISWNFIAAKNAFRYCPPGFLFDVAGSSLFTDEAHRLPLLGFLGSKAAGTLLEMLNPTFNTQAKDIRALPLPDFPPGQEISTLVAELLTLSREDWDESELSRDFVCHPMLSVKTNRLSDAFSLWRRRCEARFSLALSHETILNQRFLSLCGLEEISPDVLPEDITLLLPDETEAARSFLSFAVGCALGRFTPPFPFTPAPLGVLTADDLCARVIDFLTLAFGETSLEENLAFLSHALHRKEPPRDALCHYLSHRFFLDHEKYYRHRPLYWQFENEDHSFLCLAYCHRLTPDSFTYMASLAPPPYSSSLTHAKSLLPLSPDLGIRHNRALLSSLLRPATGESE